MAFRPLNLLPFWHRQSSQEDDCIRRRICLPKLHAVICHYDLCGQLFPEVGINTISFRHLVKTYPRSSANGLHQPGQPMKVSFATACKFSKCCEQSSYALRGFNGFHGITARLSKKDISFYLITL